MRASAPPEPGGAGGEKAGGGQATHALRVNYAALHLKIVRNYVALHKIAIIWAYVLVVRRRTFPLRDPSRRSRPFAGRARGHIISPPFSKDPCHGQSHRSLFRLDHSLRGPRADARLRRKGRLAGTRQL